MYMYLDVYEFVGELLLFGDLWLICGVLVMVYVLLCNFVFVDGDVLFVCVFVLFVENVVEVVFVSGIKVLFVCMFIEVCDYLSVLDCKFVFVLLVLVDVDIYYFDLVDVWG